MIGLREHRRDPELPLRAGDQLLVPPAPAELLDLVRAHLARPGCPSAQSAALTYARWKPHTSITAGYSVDFVDGARRTVCVKKYMGPKAEALRSRDQAEPRPDLADDHLEPRVVLPERALHLWSFPHDRALPGLERLLDMRRTARMLRELGLFTPLEMRPGPSTREVLRYKPERRAVLALRAGLRPPGHGPRSYQRLIARALAPAEAARTAEARRAVERGSLLPRLLGVQERTGIVLEEWLDIRVAEPDSFDHAAEAGRALALLHRGERPVHAARKTGTTALRPLFEIAPDLWPACSGIEPPTAGDTRWIHGDFHPDQIGFEREGGRARLLDLDLLAPGDPIADLASWVADHVSARRDVGFEEARAPLIDGYRAGGGDPVSGGRLAGAVAWTLAHLAAGSIRRLERGAEEKARELLERARAIAGEGAHAP